MDKHEGFAKLWHDERGVLTFEWVLILTILIIGSIGGIASVRDALIVEMSTFANAMGSVNLSYVIQPYESGLTDEDGVPLFVATGSLFGVNPSADEPGEVTHLPPVSSPNEYHAPMARPRVFTSSAPGPVHPVPIRQWAEGSGVAKGGAVGG